ncbi:hypothetical protein GEV33_004343 [Tenebrio molitor]|uniref:Reverse transcriptase n=1 Tax=Tenebrio molitor TaxID=7067 RepID=A0A8J6HRR7_TENMO|nr:hypothetical protein GEV33_004343 [Tenebrio molitor]
MQLPRRLIAQRNKVQIFRKLEDSVGDRRAGGCAARRELRITCVAFGIRNHPRERIADRHGAYRPALPAFGAVEEPEDLPLPYRTVYCLPWSRNPSSSSEIEEYRKVLLQFTAEQPLSAGGRSPHDSFGSSPDQLSLHRAIVRKTIYRPQGKIISFPPNHFENVKVTPLEANHYRPINLTSSVVKIMESIIVDKLDSFTSEFAIIPKEQCSFMKGKSVETNLLSCLNDWSSLIDWNDVCLCVCLSHFSFSHDYSKTLSNLTNTNLPVVSRVEKLLVSIRPRGVEEGGVDMLSRPAMPEENAELYSALRFLEIELPRRNELEIRTEQLKDPDLKKIIDALTNVTPEVAQPWLNRGYLLNSGLLQTPVLQQRMEVIAIDLFRPLPPASTGERWIIIIEDYATQISKAFTAVYHPEANPVERRNRDLKTQLAIQIRDKPHSDWPRQLSSIRFAMNTARSQSTGKTPAFLLFGNEIRSIDDVTNAVWSCLKISLLKPHPDFYNSMKAGRKLERPTKRNKIAVSSTPTSNAGLPPRSNPVTSSSSPLDETVPTSFYSRTARRATYDLTSRDKPAEPLGTYHVLQLTPYPESEVAALKPVHPIKKRGRPRKNQIQ